MSLVATLTQLETTELIRRLEEQELAYLFKHALVQDTAYTSLLKNERKRLHLLIGETIERAFPETLDENAARLAQHYAEAGVDAKTYAYALRAGDAAARVYANPEALTLYALALKAAASLDLEASALGGLYAKLGRVYEVSGAFERALACYQELSDLAVRRHDRALALNSLMLRATLHATPTPLFDAERGQVLLDEALALAEELHDGAAQTRLYWNLLLLYGFGGHPAQAIVYGEQGIQLARALGLKQDLAFLLNDIASFGYYSAGQSGRALEAILEARSLWQELGNLPMLADNLNNSALANYLRGDFLLAEQEVERAQELASAINNLWGENLGRMIRAQLYMERGNFERALAEAVPAYTITREQKLGLALIGGTILAMIYAEVGAAAEGYAVICQATAQMDIPAYRASSRGALAYLTLLQDGVLAAEPFYEHSQLSRGGTLFFPLPLVLFVGEMGLRRGAYVEVADEMQNWREQLERMNLKSGLADALFYRARALHALGADEAARAAVGEGCAIAEQVGSARVLWKLCALASALERRAGDEARAHPLAQQARAMVASIADHTPAQYRERFLARAKEQWACGE